MSLANWEGAAKLQGCGEGAGGVGQTPFRTPAKSSVHRLPRADRLPLSLVERAAVIELAAPPDVMRRYVEDWSS